MNREDILQIARECGAEDYLVSWNRTEHGFTPENLERFAHRIERETLLKAADIADDYTYDQGNPCNIISRQFRRMAEKIGKE